MRPPPLSVRRQDRSPNCNRCGVRGRV